MATTISIVAQRLKNKGHDITSHNIQCEMFAMELEALGAMDLLDTICYDGSEAQRMANEQDKY